MKVYRIIIGNMGGQSWYTVKAENKQEAKKKAIKEHKEKGRTLDGKTLWFV